MAIACVLSYSSYFSVFLVMFCLLFMGVLCIDFWAGNRTSDTELHSAGRSTRSSIFSINTRWLFGSVSRAFPLAVVGAGLIFLFMPRYQGLALRTLPVSWDLQFSLAKISEGDILNRNADGQGDSLGKPQQVSGDDYFGFGSSVNLNARGSLSNSLVMKVRTSHWQYHRGVSFSEYTGTGWKSIPWEPVKREIESPPFTFPIINWRDERVTIYYVNRDLPNVVFTPPSPARLYFPSNELYVVDSFNPEVTSRKVVNLPATLVSPFFMEEGLVYSTLNQTPSTTIPMLRQRRSSAEPSHRLRHFEPFLQLPPTVTQRTRDLALRLSEGKDSAWAKAAALSSYLQQNYTYRLDVPFYPEQSDTVDHFLFEAKEGYCEQFATALCVMARSVGLPARYVTGFLPGTFNPITGFYEIKSSDAHAWAEIYFEGYGWMLFDPVPGGEANPEATRGEQQSWLFESLLEYIKVPPCLRDSLPNLMRLFAAAAALSLVVALLRRQNENAGPVLSQLAPYLSKAEAITEKRAPGETVRAWSNRLKMWPELGILADFYDNRYYRGDSLTGGDFEILEKTLADLKQSVKAGAPHKSL